MVRVVGVGVDHGGVLGWYERERRVLPWREDGVSSWGVLVSEVMLQQTPVGRVLPVYREWMERWPAARDLARVSAGEAVRGWGRLGYPRRALRLHETARILTEKYDGEVPDRIEELRRLPGVGGYTAAAVASFAFGQRHAVLDTNVRRVFARLVGGREFPGRSVSVAEIRLAESLLPVEPAVAARWSVAVMELGALVCTAARPLCEQCPLAGSCSWLLADRPQEAVRPTGQKYEGTDRQCRGALLAVLRDAAGPVPAGELSAAWPEPVRRARALDTLVADGLVEVHPDGSFSLPTT
jgi:A/G-specific adenine glycosylase